MSAPGRLATFAVAMALIAFIGFLDVATGLVPDMTILYLIPIVAVTYLLGIRYGLPAVVVASAVEAFAAIQQGLGFGADLVLDAVMHFLVFSLGAILIDRLLAQLTTITVLEQRRGRDLAIAREIHESVFEPVQTQYEDLAVGIRVEFARELGGDYYYVTERDDKRFFCIADISGKGIAAALFSALLHQNIINALKDSADPREIGRTVNKSMYAALPDNMFITLFCALIDDASITYINAGHEPPLLYSRQRDDVSLLQGREPMPVGIEPELGVVQESAPFGVGDIVLAVTDGITESAAFRHEPFVELERVLRERKDGTPQEIADAVFFKANPVGQATPADDTVVVCFKRQARLG